MRKVTITSFGFAAALAMAVPALAFRDGDSTSFAAIHQDNEVPKIAWVQIVGSLTCNMPQENDGSPCTLKLRDAKSGRIYNLIQASSAMRLYQDGTKNVRIHGRMADPETIVVIQASST